MNAIAKFENSQGICEIKISSDEIISKFISTDNDNVLDHFSIKKTSGNLNIYDKYSFK
jgi:hypothetical protein